MTWTVLYKVSHSKLDPKLYGEIDKKALFSNFLFFFTFAQKTKKIIFFCKKFDGKMHKKLIFHFLTVKSYFLTFRFLHYVLRWETEKKVKKKRKKGIFFLNSQNFIILFYTLYAHFKFSRPNMNSQNRKQNLQFNNFAYIFFFIFLP